MVDRPQATVLLTSCDQATTVGAALDAALAQQGGPFEILISDDASEDASLEVIRARVAGYLGPHQVRVRANRRRLGRDHFTLLSQQAAADFIIMGHGDDVMRADRGARLLAAHRATGASLVLSHAVCVDDRGASHGLLAPEPLPSPQGLAALAKLAPPNRMAGYIGALMAWHRDVYDQFPRLDRRYLPAAHDTLLVFRAALLGGVAVVPEPLVRYAPASRPWYIDNAASPDGDEEIRRYQDLAIAVALGRDIEHLRRAGRVVDVAYHEAVQAHAQGSLGQYVQHRNRVLVEHLPAWLPRGRHRDLLAGQTWLQLRWFCRHLRRRLGF